MRRIDILFEKFSNQTVSTIKNIAYKNCVYDMLKCSDKPRYCKLECEKCWNKEASYLEIKNNLERITNV